ncbi:hypothetical protein CI610_02724 [invertebrate metagenome]|uniref:Type ISP restriction-modification enzyme LLaBIII C-terminal specificity domain-containing protein n=1 Tax=invertebrate metagenome TaxID=1711999 RepID=A0A2H9T569_9ZZZZ
MVKDPAHTGACELFYHDIGDHLSREEKLAIVEQFGSIDNMEWQSIKPNDAGDWINQRDPAFEHFSLLDGKDGVFTFSCNGIQTNRGAWVYHFDKKSHIKNDPNDWSDDPRYIIDLVKRIIRVSVKTMRIVKALPPLNEAKN